MKLILFLLILTLPAGLQRRVKDFLFSPQGPNILILSFCSLNNQSLPIFGGGLEKDAPNFARVFNRSFNFVNGINDLSWANIDRFVSRFETLSFKLRNYQVISSRKSPPYSNAELEDRVYQRVPEKTKDYSEYFGQREEETRVGVADAIKMLEGRSRDSSFLLQLHFKYMHMPYLPVEYSKDRDFLKSFLSREEMDLLLEYQSHFKKYPEKMAFFQALFANPDIVSYIESIVGKKMLTIDPESLQQWKVSINYDKDLVLLKKVYGVRLTLLDAKIKPLIDYYNSELSKDTILVLTGDHGEAFMEHGLLAHASNPYDEVLRFFFSVHLPGQDKPVLRSEQLSQASAGGLVAYAVVAGLNHKNMDGFVQRSRDKSDVILSYSCDGTKISAREKNKWKLIYYVNSNKLVLFDLENDPGETVDVHEGQPLVVERLKSGIDRSLLRCDMRPGRCINCHAPLMGEKNF